MQGFNDRVTTPVHLLEGKAVHVAFSRVTEWKVECKTRGYMLWTTLRNVDCDMCLNSYCDEQSPGRVSEPSSLSFFIRLK